VYQLSIRNKSMASTTESFLDRILDHKRAEVEQRRRDLPLEALAERCATAPQPRSFAAALRQPGRVTLIAEVKKASPSKGVLIENFDPLALAQVYTDNGAAAISVLTDERFFQGSLTFLAGIRSQQPAANGPPLLRKDFIIDPYQIYEARAYGADALLLIVAALNDAQLGALLALTHELGMQALVEVHNEAELDRALHAGAAIIGVNNRDLHTFVTTLETTERLAARMPEPRPVLVSESGIFSAADVARVRACGADAVLVGEALVKAEDTAARVRELAGVHD
jgi:indole-3-glycerol phosphate synthase